MWNVKAWAESIEYRELETGVSPAASPKTAGLIEKGALPWDSFIYAASPAC